ncbi:MAG TPA: DUF2933 domain-containing protein [Acidimicrobiales bacterium]|nr:DUF2933 domain-containing protein [Acidimicrobiales bacterium]
MCFNKRVVAGLGVAALAVFAFAPNLIGAVLPLLALAACPLSMLLLMRGMTGTAASKDASCSANGSHGGTASTDRELAELRAELERLRRDQAQEALGARADGLS